MLLKTEIVKSSILWRETISLQCFLILYSMKKILFLLLMGLLFLPSKSFGDSYETEQIPPKPIPYKSPTVYLVNVWIDSETGVFSILANYDIACLYVTIEQNNVVLDSFSQPLYNGVPATYNFSTYNTGEYIVTLSTADGVISRYRVTVIKD
jgi:hypothetical protein